MHELTVTKRKPTKNYPDGRHEWTGPLGTAKYVVPFDAADYPVGTVLRVEIVEPTQFVNCTHEEAVAAHAGEIVAEQSPPREKPVRGERSNPPREMIQVRE